MVIGQNVWLNGQNVWLNGQNVWLNGQNVWLNGQNVWLLACKYMNVNIKNSPLNLYKLI